MENTTCPPASPSREWTRATVRTSQAMQAGLESMAPAERRAWLARLPESIAERIESFDASARETLRRDQLRGA